ncbi:OmcA/MtrC family decaheme c-type cytochrome [Shewanella sp. SNU WT4]|uniref:OmcA/MtrC family decaheme c-type cytochrome n=1 Tax=Shewanella sp. SNU WT4 TaxID=2590015 RepID=UPI00112CEF88|nr:OmcA/MtrC family decaheme c-type cytochrome [Shewanella sp. SNU WT4]QDF66656.1 OmcA/MtrC family decaheme c-type cytochrome [Shewanella sp. SNU WT4]
MMNTQIKKIALLIASSMLSVGLAGCGSDGDNGSTGKPGGPAANTVAQLKLDVTDVNHQGSESQVTVFATNEQDLPVVGLKDLEIKKLSQLIPHGATGAGNSAAWQTLGATKVFIDNKDGSYSFKVDVKNFDPALTQRFNIIAAASTLQDGTTSVPRTEYTEDLASDGSAPRYTKNVVATETCNTCHAEGVKIYHGYTSLESCTTCHNDDMAKDKNKVQVGFNHLIHNVHNSNKMYGKNLDKSAETAHNLIQDNCQACHIPPQADDNGLTEWNNWSRVPTMETCTSCHTTIDFKAGKGHSQQVDNSNCVACHNSQWTTEIHTGKVNTKKELINSYGLSSELVANSNNTATLTVTITDKAGTAVDAASLLPKIKQLETITNVGTQYAIMGYNPAPETGFKKVAQDLVKNGALVAPVALVNGKLVFTTPVLPFNQGAADTNTAFSFIGLGMCNDGTAFVNCADGVDFTGMKADLAFAAQGGKVTTRHIDSVAIDTCINCHGDSFDIHKGYHAGFVLSEQLGREIDGKLMTGIDGCVSCHTPHGTYGSGANKGALELKLHKTHSAFYGLIGGNCSQCHNDFNLDAFKAKGALATDGGVYTTPITATCGSCHIIGSEYFDAHTQAQLEGFGAVINGDFTAATQAAQSETCLFCHKPTVANHGHVEM